MGHVWIPVTADFWGVSVPVPTSSETSYTTERTSSLIVDPRVTGLRQIQPMRASSAKLNNDLKRALEFGAGEFHAARDLTLPLLKICYSELPSLSVVETNRLEDVGIERGVDTMAERIERSAVPNLLAVPEMAEMGKKRIENFVDAQRELLSQIQETNRQWFDRMQSEAKIASDFANKVMGARSVPDAMTACQEWANWQLKTTAEDNKRLCADGQKFIEASTRLLSGRLYA